jgi:pimeloyl-ACP methyl ester carboxylesterase
MPNYANLGSVHTWYDERGNGEPLVLLHPGLADARAFDPNLDALATHFHVFAPDRRGHGHTPDVDGPLTYELMAEDTIAFLDTVVGAPAHLLGYSDGAIVALLAALRRPDLTRRLVFVAGVFHRDGWAPGVIDPDNNAPDFMARSYGEVSPDGIDHFPVVAAKLAHTHARSPTLSTDDLADLSIRTLVMMADDDEVILEHAIAMYRSLRDAELAIIPGTSHGLLVEKPSLCNSIITDFLTNDPTPTLAPIRRTPPRHPN